MNILLFVLAIVWAAVFVVYEREVVQKKNFHNRYKRVLATIAAPAVLLLLVAYSTSSFVVSFKTRQAVINDPAMLLDAMENMEQVQREREAKASKEALKNIKADDSKYAPIAGNPDGKIVIYEFYDYNCGFCKRAAGVMTEVLRDEKDVKVVLKNLPIFPVSQIPARAVVAAQQQGKAAELHALFFENNLVPEANEKATEKDMNEKIKAIVFGLAQKAGLDVERLKKDMESPAVEEELLRTRQLAEKLQIQGTPAFIVGDQLFRGYIEAPQMRDAIESAK
ncbi:MAG: DsbA family protein [Rickettsiales bacterium]|jgi:protein-disulfide isomerase|nr:DsbA family protein [Rickettsiales bacterium]